MDAHRTVDVWWCSACKLDGTEGPFPDGGGPADWPRFCWGCHVFLENPLTEKGIAETRVLIGHPVCSPAVAGELRAFYQGVL
jgi:hypothetical protein